jgi:hypothetical protein
VGGGQGHGHGSGHELENPKFGSQAPGAGQDRAGQDRLQPAACNAQTAKSGRRRYHRATHLANARPVAHGQAHESEHQLRNWSALEVFVPSCLRVCHPICLDHLVGTRILDECDLQYLQNEKSKSYGFHVTARSSFPTARLQAKFNIPWLVALLGLQSFGPCLLAVSAAWAAALTLAAFSPSIGLHFRASL